MQRPLCHQRLLAGMAAEWRGMTVLDRRQQAQDKHADGNCRSWGYCKKVIAAYGRSERNLNLRLRICLRGGFHNSLATLPATRKMHAAWSSDWMMKPRRS